jgi:hypothetical protein
MPFTFAHPAVILPLAKNKKLPLQALVIGSLVPDFEFYLQLREVKHIGHSILGFFVVDIPLGLLILFIYNKYITVFLRTIAPSFILYKCNTLAFEYRSYKKKFFNYHNVYAMAIGILTHLFLDLFTHHDSYLIQLFPVLSNQLIIMNYKIKIVELNQIFLSLIGLVIIAVAILNIKPTVSAVKKINKTNLGLLILIGTIILVCRLYFFNSYNKFWSIIIAAIGALIYSLIINSILFSFKKTLIKLNK